MQAKYNPSHNNYCIEITTDDLEKAFSSELNLYYFLYDIVKSTYGIEWAEKLYGKAIAQKLKEIDNQERNKL